MPHRYNAIEGWFDFLDIYSEAVEKFDNTLFLECGSFQGRSACYLAEAIKEGGKNIKLISVDLFPTNDEINSLADSGAGQSVEKDIIRALPDSLLNTFVKNIANADVSDVIIPIKSDSIKASSIFPDEHFSMIFLDDCHFHNYVLQELAAWWPKVKHGGIYAGHDYYNEVARAVDEFFRLKDIKVARRSSSWFVIKE